MTENEFKFIEPYIQTGWGYNVGCKNFKMNQGNIKNIDEESPHADFITNFLESGIGNFGHVDFILMNHYLRTTDSPVEHLVRAWELLKPGGKLILTETKRKTGDKHNWKNPEELLGLLSIFSKFFFRETIKDNGESYTVVYQRRKPCFKNTQGKAERK